MNHKQFFLLCLLGLISTVSFLPATGVVYCEPKLADSLAETVNSYYCGNFDAALFGYRDYITKNPTDNEARLNLIRLCNEAGRVDEALTQLQQLIELNPTREDYRSLLLKQAYLSGKPNMVIKNASNIESKPEKQFWLGLALADLGKTGEAIQRLEGYLAGQPFDPAAYYMAGRLYLKTNNFEKAQTCFLRALTQEPNFTVSYYPLALTYLAMEKYPRAYQILSNAAAMSPSDPGISSALHQLVAGHPELIKQQQETGRKNRQVAAPPQVAPILKDRDKIPEIRIGLAAKVGQLYFKTGGAFLLEYREDGNTRTIPGEAQTILEVRQNNGLIKIYNQSGTVLCSSGQNITLSYKDPGATTILFDVEYGTGMFWSGRESRTYRGQIQLLAKKEGITVINRVNVEEYLYAVVASEMSPSWPAAALEAQAIAARTYAFANMGQYELLGFDLWGTVISQAYSGVSAETASTRAAVDASRGEIITYNGKPIAAFFTGNSGGYTENSQDLWNFSLPYLQAVPDPLLPPRDSLLPPDDLARWLSDRPETYSSHPKYSARSSYRWVLWVPRLELENRINSGKKIGTITSVITMDRGFTGVVKQVLVKGTAGEYLMKSDEIRTKLGGLRSNLFVVEPKLGVDGLPEYFIFTGAGWGHGIGMCQSGAAGMAAAGIACADILKHYYPGTALEKRY
jgi:SpoIID/LytB domain protein